MTEIERYLHDNGIVTGAAEYAVTPETAQHIAEYLELGELRREDEFELTLKDGTSIHVVQWSVH